MIANISNKTEVVPYWLAPPLDAWSHHREKLVILFTYYIVCFVIGQFVNWLCLLNINKTSLTQSARYLMVTQCAMNICYISINFPYKAAILYLQKIILPWPLKIFCGWLHLMIVFGSMFLQDVMAVTRVLYIVFPTRAASWFNTRTKCLTLPLIPVVFGLLYSFPSVHPCCYRLYKFTSYAMSYVGPKSQTQLQFSIAGSLLLIFTLTTCYTWVIVFIKRKNKDQARKLEERGRKSDPNAVRNEKKERRLAALFGITGGVWLVYLIMFYTIYWSGLFEPYSVLLLANEMLEQFLFFVDPIVYIAMSSELRKTLLKVFGLPDNAVDPLGATIRAAMTGGFNRQTPTMKVAGLMAQASFRMAKVEA